MSEQGTSESRYRPIERIGVGGMASVFLAEDSVLGRKVAIKRLHPERADEAAARFQREAMLTAGLSHPNLVAVYDVFTEGSDFVIVMEYVAGQDLSQALKSGPPDEKRGLAILQGLAAAIDHVHAAGIVHRDVKPSNVLLTASGDTAKLTDLGIARVLEDTSTTQANAMPGSLPYMSPEQLNGERAGPPADIYAFALVAYEVLTGQRVRSGEAAAIAHQAVTVPPPDIREVRPGTSPETAEALQRGMAREPAERPHSAGEMVAELRRAMAGPRRAAAVAPRPAPAPEPTEPVPVPAPDRPPSRPKSEPPRSNARRWVPAALLAIAAVVGLVLVLSGGGDSGGEPGEGGNTQARDDATAEGGGGGSAGGNAPTAAPEEAVQDFYEAAADGDFDAAVALASPALEAQLGGADGIAGTFDSLESVEFESLSTISESGSAAEVELATTATHTDRTESCQGTASVVLSGDVWLVDQVGIDCQVIG